jgi:hypothetical protein
VIAGFARYPSVVDVDMWEYADRSREDESVGMSAGVLFAELSSAKQIGDDGVVMGELLEAPRRE